MNKYVYRLLFSVFCLVLSTVAFAQDKPEMADTMRSNGKIYVVLAVCITILAGLILYVASIDKKIGKIEKDILSD